MDDTPPKISGKELLDFGYVQEANRQFFHPLGLAMGVSPSTDEIFVYDYRDDPEGIIFGENTMSRDKTLAVVAEQAVRNRQRSETLGWTIQPPVELN